MITTVLAFLLTLGVLIVIHEYGHYRVAVACGVKVLRFSVGVANAERQGREHRARIGALKALDADVADDKGLDGTRRGLRQNGTGRDQQHHRGNRTQRGQRRNRKHGI